MENSQAVRLLRQCARQLLLKGQRIGRAATIIAPGSPSMKAVVDGCYLGGLAGAVTAVALPHLAAGKADPHASELFQVAMGFATDTPLVVRSVFLITSGAGLGGAAVAIGMSVRDAVARISIASGYGLIKVAGHCSRTRLGHGSRKMPPNQDPR